MQVLNLKYMIRLPILTLVLILTTITSCDNCQSCVENVQNDSVEVQHHSNIVQQNMVHHVMFHH